MMNNASIIKIFFNNYMPPTSLDLKKQILESDKFDLITYRELPEDLKNDEEITRAFLNKMPWLIKVVPEKFKKNKQLLLDLMEKDPWAFNGAASELKADIDFVVASIEKTKGVAFFLCAAPVASSPQVLEAARAQNIKLNS